MSAITFATLGEFVGRELGVSPWTLIDQARIDQFAACTGDRQWIHVDVERARVESPFKTTIAHGYLLLSTVAPSVLELLVEPAGIRSALNYGLDRVRFLSPVRAGSRIRNRVKLVSVEPKGDDRALVTTEHAVEIDGEDKPAVIAQALALVMR